MNPNPQSPSTTPVLESQPSQLPAQIPVWRFWVPLLCQTAILLAAPAQPFYTYMTGKTVVLQTVPVDPYDILRGYSQTLSYEVSRPENLKSLPGWKELVQQQTSQKAGNSSSDYLPSGTNLYVILEASSPAEAKPPKAWKPVRVSGSSPNSLPENQIALKGKSTGSSIKYGLETYYFPEDQREQLNKEISQAQWSQPRQPRQRQPFVVEVKVDAQGNAVPISLWVRDRNYRF